MDFNKIAKDGECKFELMFHDGTGTITARVTAKGVNDQKDLHNIWKRVFSYAIGAEAAANVTLVGVVLLPVREWEDK